MSNRIKLTRKIAPHFHEAHKLLKNNGYAEYWLSGGRGSTKSSFISLEIILGIVNDPKANAVILRKAEKNLRDTVYNQMQWAINELGWGRYFKISVSPMKITYLPTGQEIKFRGLDDPEKVKGMKFVVGYPKYIWFEEITEFNGIAEIMSVQQSLERGTNEPFVTFMSYNPPKESTAWVNEEVEEDPHYRYTHHSTYLTVPKDWLGESFLMKAEEAKKNKPELYNNQYLGIATGMNQKVIFHGCWEELDFETPDLNDVYQSRLFYGVDWGFAKDPTTMVRCFIRDNNLYIDQEVAGTGVEFEEIPELFDNIEGSREWEIVADCARPETISYVSRQGFNIIGSQKWDGSIKDGIEYLRGFNMIYVHPRCKGIINEFKHYSYKVDKNILDEDGNPKVLPVIDDKAGYDHHIDALRYALQDYIKKDFSILDVL
jgi:PBSX family phage terminase large subunit